MAGCLSMNSQTTYYNMTIIILYSQLSLNTNMINKSRCSNPAQPFIQLNHEANFVIYDDQPKQRYVQQAAPARHGAWNILFNQIIDNNNYIE